MQFTSNSDKITRDHFDSLLIETRYLDAVLPTTEMTLFGETFRTPIMTAALSHLHNSAQNGMTIYAQAAAQSGDVHWVGMGSDEELAADPDERKKWIDYAVCQLRMADAIGAVCCVNVVGTPYGPRWDGGYRDNFSSRSGMK